MVYGKTKVASATGESAESRNISRARDTRATGKTPKKSAAFIEFSFSSMKKTPEYSPKDSKRPICQESMLIL
jgi:hypothetical protein